MALDRILQRSSVRHFQKYDLTVADIDVITKIINSSPTSTNAHQFSAILITEQHIKDQIMKLNYGQKHIGQGSGVIVFIGDRNRINDIKNRKKVHLDYDYAYALYEVNRMVMDASIASGLTQTALSILGYGVAYIGGLQTKGHEVAKLLNLPKHCFVVVGLSFGIPARQITASPRFNKVFLNRYNLKQSRAEVKRYNNANKTYFHNFAKKDYVDLIAEQFAPTHYYYQHFLNGGKYLADVIKKLE